MGIGPVFELSPSVRANLAAILNKEKIRVDEVNTNRVLFRRRLGCILGNRVTHADKTFIWLTSPKSHAVNPFLWLFDARLNTQIERLLTSNGAKPTAWGEFYRMFDQVFKGDHT